jgi:hypothetical protein
VVILSRERLNHIYVLWLTMPPLVFFGFVLSREGLTYFDGMYDAAQLFTSVINWIDLN